MEAGFKGLHFWVKDMARTVAFYRAIGLGIPPNAEQEEFVNVALEGGVGFAFATDSVTQRYDPGFTPSSGRSANALQFDLPSREAVDAMYATLTAEGHTGHLVPIDAFWGARYAEVCDPDGNVVGFHSPRQR